MSGRLQRNTDKLEKTEEQREQRRVEGTHLQRNFEVVHFYEAWPSNRATFGDTTQLEWKRLVPPGAEPDAAALSSPKAGKTEAGLNAKPRWLSRRHQINLPPTGHHYRAPERKAIIVPPIFCRVCKRGKEAGELHAPCACLDRYRYAH